MTDSCHNAGRRTDDMRQESEIFTTTTFFFKRTIRITTNMVGPHNFFFCVSFWRLVLIIIIFYLSGRHPPASSPIVLTCAPFRFWAVQACSLLSVNIKTPQMCWFSLSVVPILQSASFLFWWRLTEICSLNVPGRPRVEGVFSHGVVGVADVGVFCWRH